MKRALPVSLGRYGDDPFPLIERAGVEVSSDPRMAAERAYLAIHTALENAAGEAFRTDGAQRSGVGRLAKRDKTLSRKFEDLKRRLHSKCFYQGECDSGSAGVAIGEAKAWIERLPRKI